MPEITAQVSTTIEALTQEFEILTHNLANASTVGYKRRCNAFSSSLKSHFEGVDSYSPGTLDINSALDFSQGNLVRTGRPMDCALFGRGFFVVETPNGPLYTRNGVLRTNQNGQLVDSSGRIIAGQAGPITIPATVAISQLHIAADGTIAAGAVNIGKFQIVDFGQNENKLVPAGENCLSMPDENVRPVAAENTVVKQGFQEASNVKIVDELVDMIMVTRLYQANMKLISAQSESTGSIMTVAMG